MIRYIKLFVLSLALIPSVFAATRNLNPGDTDVQRIISISTAVAHAVCVKQIYNRTEAPVPTSLDDIHNLALHLGRAEPEVERFMHSGGVTFLDDVREAIQHFNQLRQDMENPENFREKQELINEILKGFNTQ
ncbi:MAG: hypothetical protein K2X98_02790 [Alphaproteobacteria bacterium]|nr:hypothetical protein [Alphaproteobacteria bacterium]